MVVANKYVKIFQEAFIANAELDFSFYMTNKPAKVRKIKVKYAKV